MDLYPLTFEPLYKEAIWGGRNLQRLFGRTLPGDGPIGESWELTDLAAGVSRVANGPLAGRSLTDLCRAMGPDLLGAAPATPDGRFPLLLKFLDATDRLSLQVHPDEQAARRLGPPAAAKCECWYILESRQGYIYKGLRDGVTAADLRRAVEQNRVEEVVRRVEVAAGDFQFLPAGLVHALGPGVMVAEVQTPYDTTYRLSDWGRGRPTHLDAAMACLQPELSGDTAPGAAGDCLVSCDRMTVWRRRAAAGQCMPLPTNRCVALMALGGEGEVRHDGTTLPAVAFTPGSTLLLPAGLRGPRLHAVTACRWLEVLPPER